MSYLTALVLAVGFGVPFATFMASLAQGKVGAASAEAMARQPEAGGRLFISMMVALGFIESLVIYALLLFFILLGKLPSTAEVLSKIATP